MVVGGEASTHVVLVNWGVPATAASGKSREGEGDQAVTVTWADLGWAAGTGADVRDIWSHEDLAPVEPGPTAADTALTVVLPPGGSAILKLTPQPQDPPKPHGG